MEELGPIIMFVLYILYIIFGGSKKDKKKTNKPIFQEQNNPQNNPQNNDPKQKPSSLEDYLKDIIEQSQEPVVVKNQPKPRVEKPVVKQKTNSEHLDMRNVKTVEQVKRESSNMFNKSRDEKVVEKRKIVDNSKSSMQTKLDDMKAKADLEKEENALIASKLQNFEFDGVDAVIYNEIFNRKY